MIVNRIGKFFITICQSYHQKWRIFRPSNAFLMPAPSKKTFNFSWLLLKWNREKNRRQMPWKGEKDPYKIWISEIILQQTRVEQGLSYYNTFIKRFPDVHTLAGAKD